MDQGNPVSEGDAVAVSPHARLTPLRAALLVMGAVLGGVALSLILGSSPAQAADDPGAGQGPLAPVASEVTSAVSSLSSTAGTSIDAAMPVTRQAIHRVGGSLVGTVPATAPLVAPVLTGVDATLAAVDRAIVPTVDQLLQSLRMPSSVVGDALILPSTGPMSATSSLPAPAVTSMLTTVAGGPDQTIPDPLPTSGGSAGAGILGVIPLTLFALTMLGGRARRRDDGLPASPFFETDTSPA